MRLGTRVGPACDGPAVHPTRRDARGGVDLVWARHEKRDEAWHRLAIDLDLEKLNSMTAHARLDDVPSLAAEILTGNIRGRLVIDL